MNIRTLIATAALLPLIGCTAETEDTPSERAAETLLSEASEVPDAELDEMVANARVEQRRGSLGPQLRSFLKGYVVSVSESNTGRRDNLAEVRRALLPAIALLSLDFAANRPEDELALTTGAWKSIWDDSDATAPPPPLVVDGQNIYQVVEDGFYYNVTNQAAPGPEGELIDTQYFLKGQYTIARPATDENQGELALNVVDLEFADSVVRLGDLEEGADLRALVAEIDQWVTQGEGVGMPPIPAPGPAGQTGLLFNLYIDEDLRIAAGFSDDEPDDIGLFVLRRAATVGPLASAR